MRKVTWLLVMLLVGATLAGTWAASPGKSSPGKSSTGKPASAKEEGIQFTEASWKDVLKKAKAEKKIIFLDAYASWCGPCKMLQKKVFTQRAVGDLYNSKFINVKMDMEKGEGPALSEVYPLEAYPTLLYINADGRVIRKVVGAIPAEELIAVGRSIR
ncbi:thioredoxin family protein [Spirosoma rhododendri]|uniref:Thioredoxin n=1 Tax=Spirosoma rhododendri TaxID=2728024 RepID=A0A7L5DIV0_9BACT|nr:thioredoxin family protein [Spirosoma rhododendri]QJD77342.1 thioredoxin [Spirosoma rhododendri]